MQNSNNIGFNPMGPNTIELPDCFLIEKLTDFKGTLIMKRHLTEVFSTYLLQTDHGGEFGQETSDNLFYLLTGLHEIIDAIAEQMNNQGGKA